MDFTCVWHFWYKKMTFPFKTTCWKNISLHENKLRFYQGKGVFFTVTSSSGYHIPLNRFPSPAKKKMGKGGQEEIDNSINKRKSFFSPSVFSFLVSFFHHPVESIWQISNVEKKNILKKDLETINFSFRKDPSSHWSFNSIPGFHYASFFFCRQDLAVEVPM